MKYIMLKYTSQYNAFVYRIVVQTEDIDFSQSTLWIAFRSLSKLLDFPLESIALAWETNNWITFAVVFYKYFQVHTQTNEMFHTHW